MTIKEFIQHEIESCTSGRAEWERRLQAGQVYACEDPKQPIARIIASSKWRLGIFQAILARLSEADNFEARLFGQTMALQDYPYPLSPEDSGAQSQEPGQSPHNSHG